MRHWTHVFTVSLLVPQFLGAQGTVALTGGPDLVEPSLPPFNVEASRVANLEPATGFATPVTSLRYQPFVDVQSRGFAEAQADVTIRGGTFENTGFKLGAVNLLDPQTGHYFSELPIDPVMLTGAQILTGPQNALHGFNSTVGTVSYDWQPVTSSGVAEAGAGTDALWFGRAAMGQTWAVGGGTLGLQASASYSQGDGTVAFGDHHFRRFGLRAQYADGGGQTDIYAGWQAKSYGWPGMYTGYPSLHETDDYDVLLLLANHTQRYGDGSRWSVGGYYRDLNDNYELKRETPGYFRPYEHETRVGSFAAEGHHIFEGTSLYIDWRSEVLADDIQSTELTWAGFMSRTYWKATLLPGYTAQVGEGTLTTAAGASWDDTNRDSGSLSPIASADYRVALSGGDFVAVNTSYTRTTQVPGYTALGSNPGPGAFSGNPDLPREAANNYEVGVRMGHDGFTFGADAFYRQHHNLADWTYDLDAPGTFRKANPVDLKVHGVETWVQGTLGQLTATLTYAWTQIDSHYDDPAVDASFYALNYPGQRATVSLKWRPVSTLTIGVDAEARHQAKNLRRTSDNDAFLASASITWVTPVHGLALSILGDNLTDSDFQRFPGVPASGRQLALRATWAW